MTAVIIFIHSLFRLSIGTVFNWHLNPILERLLIWNISAHKPCVCMCVVLLFAAWRSSADQLRGSYLLTSSVLLLISFLDVHFFLSSLAPSTFCLHAWFKNRLWFSKQSEGRDDVGHLSMFDYRNRSKRYLFKPQGYFVDKTTDGARA